MGLVDEYIGKHYSATAPIELAHTLGISLRVVWTKIREQKKYHPKYIKATSRSFNLEVAALEYFLTQQHSSILIDIANNRLQALRSIKEKR